MATPGTQGTLPEAELARQLATLTWSGLRPGGPATAIAASVWWNGLCRLGLTVPLVVAHDLGRLLSGRGSRRDLLLPREPGTLPPGVAKYRSLLDAVVASEALSALDATSLGDEMIVVLLARLLANAHARWSAEMRIVTPVSSLPLASPLYTHEPAVLARERPIEWALTFLARVVEDEAALLVRLEQIEPGTLRLFGLFHSGSLPDLVDLYQVFNTVGAGTVADFSLQLLPSLLETKRSSAAQRYAVDGYASVERKGNPDAILPSELAHDADIFDQKALADELLYYGHERPQEGTRREHGILIDASASMRGDREVFARGLGIALAKKLGLVGRHVWLSFFDSRLHRKVEVGALGGKELPYLLCFRSEQGRNYTRVFEQLRSELSRRRPSDVQDVSITFITHAECHIPTATVEALASVASLYGIFVLPSRPLALEYLSLLRGHQIVTRETLSRPVDKRRRALDIVNDVVTKSGAAARPA